MSVHGLGAGEMGLAVDLPTYETAISGSIAQRDVQVEMRPGKLFSGWSVHSGTTYVLSVSQRWLDALLDVVAVKTPSDPLLVRAASLAECIATEGTYYYDPEAIFLHPAFVWDSTPWDSGYYWDQSPKLYVHLSDGGDPGQTDVNVSFGIYAANRAAVLPTLGPNLLADGGFSLWDSGGDPEEWATALTGSWTIDQESATVLYGSYACALTYDDSPGSAEIYIASVDAETGGVYRISGAYRVPADAPDQLSLRVRVSTAGGTADFVRSDGRTYGTTDPEVFPGAARGRASDEWRRFSFDFVAQADALRVGIALSCSVPTGVSGSVVMDDVRLSRVHRFEYHPPRIAAGFVPSLQTGSNDVFFGGKRTGVGQVSLIVADGATDTLFYDLEWIQHAVIVRAGGGDDVARLPYEDWSQRMRGLVQRLHADDTVAQFTLFDARGSLHRKLPLRTYGTKTTDNVNVYNADPNTDSRFYGKPRPYFWGDVEDISPARIGFDPTYSKYGLYEVADCDLVPAGIFSVNAVYAYASESDATDLDASRRLTLGAGSDYSADLDEGTITILRDVGPIEITEDHTFLNFDVGGSELTATLTPGLYRPVDLASHVQAQCRAAVGGGDTTMSCTYSDTTNAITIAKSSGTLNLKTQSGTQKDASAYTTLGYAVDADLTGSLSYEATTELFEDPASDHVIRADITGFKDDASGTYTGTPGAAVATGPDTCRFISRVFLGQPLAAFDEPSFMAARAAAPEPIAIALTEQTSTADIFTNLERSNQADILIGGDGVIYYLVSSDDVPDNAVRLGDADFFGWSTDITVTDVYPSVVVQYDRDPTTGKYQAVSAGDSTVSLRYERNDPRTFTVYLKDQDDATRLALRLLVQATNPPRQFSFGAHGKLLRSLVGDKLVLTRHRAIDSTGALDAQAFRIISKDEDALGSLVKVTVVDV